MSYSFHTIYSLGSYARVRKKTMNKKALLLVNNFLCNAIFVVVSDFDEQPDGAILRIAVIVPRRKGDLLPMGKVCIR